MRNSSLKAKPVALVLLLTAAASLTWLGCSKTSSDPAAPAVIPDVDDDTADEEGDGLDIPGSEPPGLANTATPIPSKIRYVMVLVKENHTFDNYFTGFPGAESSKTAKLSSGKTITRKQAPTELMKDICHSNACGQRAYNAGKMNGFDAKDPDRPFYYYSEAQIPNYWAYARNFVLADHLFSTTLGPSTPGHTVFWTGQSLVLDNAKCEIDGGECKGRGCAAGADVKVTSYDPDLCTTKRVAPCFDVPALTDHLPKDFTWSNYGGAIPQMVKSVTKDPAYAKHFRTQNELLTDLKAGKLANLTIGHLWSGDVSEHPAAYPCEGENFTVDIINEAMKLPQWKEMAIVVTWDDWGGWYDHVTPPVRKCQNGQIFQAGFRLPAIVISPYAKKGFVLKDVLEQASVPRLVEELWGMEFMTKRDPHARDGIAGSMMSSFDFAQPPRAAMILEKKTCPSP
ncbi:MAG TPA: alkaline phosphatase family protein [Labilithrix sp.]|nr:alkaline phosphatase family protein [Labilithrix sp.]